MANLGSSPLARGLLRDLRVGRNLRGIIPARAGFTEGGYDEAAQVQDHPRSRGVYLRIANRLAPYVGSSPLARGLLPILQRTARAAGIIPARAGFTYLPAFPQVTPRDHPRSRGVYPTP